MLAIGNHCNPNAWPTVRNGLLSKSDTVRLASVYAAGRIGVPDAIPILNRLTKDADKSIAWQSRNSIKDIKAMMSKYPYRLTDPKAWWKF